LGRSIHKYVTCAEKAGIAKLSDKVTMFKYGYQCADWLRELDDPENWLLSVTGNQGEENSTLGKMVYGDIFDFQFEDHVVFSSRIIPVKINELNREKMENALRQKHVRIFRDIHVSGHAAREDLREMLHMVDADHFIPTHGDLPKLQSAQDLATEIGYDDENVHIIANGERLELA
jgi:ribonuclease J